MKRLISQILGCNLLIFIEGVPSQFPGIVVLAHQKNDNKALYLEEHSNLPPGGLSQQRQLTGSSSHAASMYDVLLAQGDQRVQYQIIIQDFDFFTFV